LKHQAKAPSAGSTQGSGNGRALLRRAFATRAASGGSNGSGARAGRRVRGLVATLALAICASAIVAAPASAATPAFGTVSNIFSTSVHVKGHVGNLVGETYWRFEYSTDGSNWNEGVEPIGAGGPLATSQEVEGELRGLQPATTYFVRLTVFDTGNSETTVEPGPYTSFTTLPAVTDLASVIATDDASEVGMTTAHASGEIQRPAGADPALDPACNFEYVTDAQFVANQPAERFAGATKVGCEGENPVTTESAVAVHAHLTGLAAGKTYHLRLSATNGAGTTSKEAADTFLTQSATPPTLALDAPSAISFRSAHISGSIDPEGGNTDLGGPLPIAWELQINREGAGWEMAENGVLSNEEPAGGGPIPALSDDPIPVAKNLESLQYGTEYKFRLVVSFAGNQEISPEGSFETEIPPPAAQTLYAGSIQKNSATLAAAVNPKTYPVTYQFEWGTSVTYGNKAPAFPAPLGGASDEALHFVTAPISGLQEGTTYHFRISATNTVTMITSHGDDHTFTTLAVAGPPAPCPNEVRRTESNSLSLPDCRGYELVTPAAKDFPFGAPISGNFAIAAAAGSAIAYNTSGPLPGSAAGTYENYNISRRKESGWVSTPISPPQNPVGGGQNFPATLSFTTNLSQLFLQENPTLAPGAQPNVISLYDRNAETGSYELITPGNEFVQFWFFVGSSEDSKHLVIETLGAPLLPGIPGGGLIPSVYDWSGGELHYVGILPNGTPAENIALGQGAYGRLAHAVSANGRRMVFSSGNRLYDRIDNTSTTYISASQRTVPDPNGTRPAGFWGASTDGGTVFFTSSEKLTNDATTGLNDAGQDLYAYDLGSGTLTDLSVDTNPADGATGANVQGVVGNSDDGQYVYFVATGDLGGGADSGAPNLYVNHDNQVKFIATMDPADNGVWGGPQKAFGGFPGLTARVAANGDMAFQSIAPLTGYDNVDPSTGAPTSQIYRYAPSSGDLSCLSCRADGSPPSGNSTITAPFNTTNIQRNISANGSRVFFSSTDAIVPGDTNGKSDVYEWSEGSTRLISDGTSGYNSYFQDASPNGEDVFFATAARLVGQDTDSHVDLYDARAGGGFAKPPAAPVPCEGEACRGAGSSAPDSLAPTTPSFVGPANPHPSAKATKRAKALKACKAKHSKKQRKNCESKVKKRFAKKSGRGK
jgi:hypothetical protein